MAKNDFDKLIAKINTFRDTRNWRQFHKPKDCALSLALEAAEVLEHFQWRNGAELEKYLKTNKSDIADELSDVLWWVLVLSHDLDIDLQKAFIKKLGKNTKRYPVKKVKGKHKWQIKARQRVK